MEFLKLEKELLEIYPKNNNINEINEQDEQDEQYDNTHRVEILKKFLNENLELLDVDLVHFIDKSNELKKKYLDEIKSTIIEDFGKEQWDKLSDAFDNLELYKLSEFISNNSTLSQTNTDKINSLISIHSYIAHINNSIKDSMFNYKIKICYE